MRAREQRGGKGSDGGERPGKGDSQRKVVLGWSAQEKMDIFLGVAGLGNAGEER